ncbi:hypothetical protein K7395_15555 [Streptomyces filamentosus]|uniref:Uncharacterized protein n=2 Tax=Streptomyces filamentosus TaxID=67294 RepID=A0ABY4UW87_STRFL|nr:MULTISPECIES: hypothetical protein [Streptomyces]EFE76436.1 predicted protein [Streptomyces filamentosus NRRL 15998]ESU51229.1 hypothetical protein P376_0784 [Streptomyces sp. HCCB10043]EWS93409.1 hypothetical protein SSIG_04003 [Streptomyces filamentosus NRRL 11379]MYR80417.1 hypothetical protein [Streptomyces sp. SID5466]USC48062.1 hypothetical protein K7395_15555 [Streptomyces filamentosus]
MRTYRYKVQKSGFGLLLGITAEAIRLTVPPTTGAPVSDRVWLDVAEVNNAYYGSQLILTESEVATLRVGLGKVSGDIELVESSPYILIAVRALEIFEVDYAEVALAPAIAGWAEAEFSLSPRRGHASRDSATGEFTVDWDE